MIYLYIFIFGNGEKLLCLLPLFIKMLLENYNFKLPTTKVSKDKYIDFCLYVGLILWLYLGLLKSFLADLLFIMK